VSTPKTPDSAVAAFVAPQGASAVADGNWHRMHPMTPLLKGGIVLLVLAGIVLSSIRDRLINWFIRLVNPFDPGSDDDGDFDGEYGGDPIDWLISNDMLLLGSVAALGVILLLCVAFYVVWRFHTFRITADHVEVRKGILFRSHRRAPLDRVQGVNLTRPFLARLVGLSKLEVVGAGVDANVELEYLKTSIAETLRADILRLASGARHERHAIARGDEVSGSGRLVDVVLEGMTGVVEGVDNEDVESESLVKIPAGRVIGSQLILIAPWFAIAILAVGAMVSLPIVFGRDVEEQVFGSIGALLALGIPLIISFVIVSWALISRNLRYSIAATTNGVRTTYGLLTTTTETLPPGRVHALEISQPLLWRRFGWWSVKINRMSGMSAMASASSSSAQFNVALPVGTLADVERVTRLMLTELPVDDRALVEHHGVFGPFEDDPFRVMRTGVWWRRPISWRRHGYVLTDYALYLRRGRIWRKLAIFPLARLQSFSISQGPIERIQNVGSLQAHTVSGPIFSGLVGVDREQLQELVHDVAQRSVLAAKQDNSHRWAEVLDAVLAEQASSQDAGASDPAPAPTEEAAK
jgi:putative membrane protein